MNQVEQQHPGLDCAWGKLERNKETGAVAGFHPLYDHMLDVAACFKQMVKRSGRLRGALEATGGRVLDERDIERLLVLVCLHDFGKANSGFQAKWFKGKIPQEWPLRAGHVAEARDALERNVDAIAGLPFDAIWGWGDSVSHLLFASLSHHGRPVKEPLGLNRRNWDTVRDDDGREIYSPSAVLSEIGARVRRDFPLAFELGGEPLPSAPAFAHLFAGMVQLADWLGSDQRFFRYSEPGTERSLTSAHESALEAFETIGLDLSHVRSQLTGSGFTFASAFERDTPYPVQAALGRHDLGPLLILESETGSGKTEAALWRFANLFKAGKVDSLYFALPTRVAAVQLHKRVQEFVKRLWPKNAPVVVRALPGYETAGDATKVELSDYKVLWSDDPGDDKALQRWAAERPKRFLAATIAVGTIDQALLAGLGVRHAHLRHAALSRSLLVVDEVHASDTYMSTLLENLLKAHHSAGGHALLLSATLGSRQRLQFQRIVDESAEELSVDKAIDSDYPALTDGKTVHGLSSQGKPKTIQWETLNAIEDYASIAQRAVDAAKKGARVLIVRNTVPAAIATQKALEALGDGPWLYRVNGVATLHHSRFSREDRPLLDACVEEYLGKEWMGKPGCVVVGTQTLEQSLDIDADFLITDICPMDVLLQRIGRLHRHKRKKGERPKGFEKPQAYVLIPQSRSFDSYLKRPSFGLGWMENGSGVYPDLRMIAATRFLIEQKPTRKIPLENRRLVERSTHPDCLKAIQTKFGADWAELADKLEGSKSAMRTFARLHKLPFDIHFQDLRFKDEERIATRLGAADRLIKFEKPQQGPFGQDVKHIAIRHHMLPRPHDPDTQPSHIVTLEDGFSFALGTARYTYTRFGIQKDRSR